MMDAMTKISSQNEVSQMFNQISPAYDRVNRILSLGIDKGWRKIMNRHLPSGSNLHLLDLATGTCDQLLELMKTGKFASALGIDLAEGMLDIGRKKVDSTPFSDQVSLSVASALEIPSEDENFDCASISFGIRNVQNPLQCLQEMHRVLKPGGRALILEFSHPKNRLIRNLNLIYLRHVLPAVGGLFSGKKSAYSYLNRTIESFPYGKAFCTLMNEAGFQEAKAHPLTMGVATLYIGEKS